MIRPILIHPDPRLKKVAEPVEAVDDAVRKLADDMLETMYDAPGIGLAGPQVGQMKRLFVMDVAEREGEDARDPMVLINPEILWASEDTGVYEEGCLSIPDIFAEVTRPAQIELAWRDRDGARHEARFDGLAATCIQHEIDHLDGKLFIDYLGAVKRMTITNKMKKLKKARG